MISRWKNPPPSHPPVLNKSYLLLGFNKVNLMASEVTRQSVRMHLPLPLPKSSFQSCHFVHNSPTILRNGKPKNPKWRPNPGQPPSPAKTGALTPRCAQCHIPHVGAAIVSSLPAAQKWSWQSLLWNQKVSGKRGDIRMSGRERWGKLHCCPSTRSRWHT